MSEVLVVLCTCPDSATAESLAGGLLEKKWAACVNILPGIRSMYRWNDEIQRDAETLMFIKTDSGTYPRVERWLVEHHPYDEPEVIALPVEAGSESYLAWVVNESGGIEN